MRETIPVIFDSTQRLRSASTKDSFHKNTYLTKEGEVVYVNGRPALTYIATSLNTYYCADGLYTLDDGTGRNTIFLYWDGTDWDLYTMDGVAAPAKLADVPAFSADNSDFIINWAEAGFDGTYFQVAFAISSTGFVYDHAGTVTEITDSDYPGGSAGMVWLDGYLFSTSGIAINNSDNADPFTWGAANYITPQTQTYGILWIALHNKHVASFGHNTIEFLYDAGNPDGSPLSPRNDIIIEDVGMYTAETVTGAGPTSYQKCYTEIDRGKIGAFISNNNGKIGVHLLKEFQAVKISNDKIDRYLNYIETDGQDRYPSISSFTVHGKTLVALTINDYVGATENAVTFVYDMETDMWEEWTVDSNIHSSGAFPVVGSAPLMYNTDGKTPLGTVVQMADGKLYLLDPVSFQDTDSGSTARDITIVIQTPKYSGSQNMHGVLKFQREMRAVCDRPSASSTLTVEYTDDDYQTFVSAGTLDLSDPASRITGLGSFYERAYRLTYADNYQFRLRQLEGVFNTGSY